MDAKAADREPWASCAGPTVVLSNNGVLSCSSSGGDHCKSRSYRFILAIFDMIASSYWQCTLARGFLAPPAWLAAPAPCAPGAPRSLRSSFPHLPTARFACVVGARLPRHLHPAASAHQGHGSWAPPRTLLRFSFTERRPGQVAVSSQRQGRPRRLTHFPRRCHLSKDLLSRAALLSMAPRCSQELYTVHVYIPRSSSP